MAAPKLRFKNAEGAEFTSWVTSFIGDECKITTGNKDTQNKIDGGKYPFFVRSQTVERINTYSKDCEAILTSGDGVGVGKNYHYINGKFDFHQRVYCLYDFSNQLLGKYLYIYFSNYFFDRVKRLSAKNSVDSVRMDMISKMEIKLPSLVEQTKIASFLSTVDEKISQLTQKHELLSQYKQGMMQKLFSQQIRFKADDGSEFGEWEETELGKHCQIKTGKLDANAMRPNGEFRFYTCAKEFYLIDEYAFDTEALLISGNGANVGYIHYYKGKFNAYQRTYVLDQWQQNIIFIQYFLEQFLKERIYGEKKEGNTPYIVLSTLSEMPLLLPCLEEQTKIANFLSAIDQKIEVVAQQIEQAKTWKKGLLQQMFI
ncbi:restriction endonuclease subunit S [Acinetobacter baumannii]|uniref:restriction endonuclease subunit S n=1 Tax=Acinetobacter baumannii TaxID=470 RepID=UPI000289AC8D|nr:restriction endonuclease subunit S [Acinetobacter baumannii]